MLIDRTTAMIRNLGILALIGALSWMTNPGTAWAAKSLKKQAQERLKSIVSLGLQSGLPAVRASAVDLCIRTAGKKEQKRCGKDGSMDPSVDVRLSTCRALYLKGMRKGAVDVLFSLLADGKVPYKGQLERVFDLPPKVLVNAKSDLLQVLSHSKLPNGLDRAQEIADTPGLFERSVLVAGAFGKKGPLRSVFRGSILSLDPGLEHETLATLFKKGDKEVRSTVVEIYEGMDQGSDLPNFLKGKPSRGFDLEMNRRMGYLLSKHRNKAAVPYLKKLLKSADSSNAQKEVLLALVPVATPECAGLARPYTDKETYEREVRWAAWAVMMRARDADALSRVERWLKSDIIFKRKMATRALPAKMGEKALHELRRLLADGQAVVRKAAAEAMGELGRPDSVTDLVYALNTQKEREERYIVAQALFKAVPMERMPDVSYVLQDQDSRIRRLALDAFVYARNEKFEPYIRPLLVDRDSSMRTAALEGLLLMDVNSGMTAFVRALNWLKGAELEVWVMRHKGLMAPYIKKALTASRENVRRAALGALNRLPDNAKVDVASSWVEKTSSPQVRVRLMELLAKTNFRLVQPMLERFAKNTDIPTRAVSIGLLAAAGKSNDLVAAGLFDTAVEVQLATVRGILVRGR